MAGGEGRADRLNFVTAVGTGYSKRVGYLVDNLSQTCLAHLVQQVMEVITTTCREQLAMLHAGVSHALQGQGPADQSNIEVSYSSSA